MCSRGTFLLNVPGNSPFLLILAPERTFSNFRSLPVNFPIPVTGFPWVNRWEKSMGNIRVSDFFSRRNKGSTMGLLPPRTAFQTAAEKHENPRELVRSSSGPISPGPPRLWSSGWSGTSPPIPANSLPSLEWGKESCRFLTMGLRGSVAKLIQSCLCPIPSAAHVTPLRWALTRSHRYYSCHGRQVAPLHYSTSGLPYHPLL